VHVPRGAQELALKVQRAQEKLTTNTGRSPTVSELAQHLELSIEDVLEGLEAAAAHHSTSLDAPHDDGEGEPVTLVDTFGQDDAGLQLCFSEERTQSEIADQIGVSQMQISRILRGAIARLSELTVSEIPVAGDDGSA
jgi:RNA polymerase sigma-B factor